MESIDQAVDRSHARVVMLGARSSRRLRLETCVRGLEFGHRGLDVVDVEPHRQRHAV